MLHKIKVVTPIDRVWVIAIAIIGAVTLFVTFSSQILPSFWLELAILTIVSIIILPFFLHQPEHWLFALLVISLSFAARFRLFTNTVHQGGAEGALAPLDFPLLLLAAFYLLKSIRRDKLKWRPSYVELGLILFTLFTIPSLFVAPDFSLGVFELLRIFKVIILFACLRRFIRTKEHAQFAIYLLLGTVLLQSILGLTQFILDRSLGFFFLGEADEFLLDLAAGGEGSSRVGGTLGHPNNFAMFLELLLPLCFSIAIHISTTARLRWLALITFFFGSATIALTLSRSGWVAYVIGILVVLLLQLRNRRFITLGKIALLVIIGIIGVAILLIFWEKIYLRLTDSSPYSLLFRQQMIIIAWRMFQAYPITGTGLNNFVLNVPAYIPTNFVNHGLPAHNIYILVLAETGFLGFGTFLLLISVTLKTTWQTLTHTSGINHATAQGTFGSIMGILAHSMLGWGWRVDAINILFWFLVGFTISLGRLEIPQRDI